MIFTHVTSQVTYNQPIIIIVLVTLILSGGAVAMFHWV